MVRRQHPGRITLAGKRLHHGDFDDRHGLEQDHLSPDWAESHVVRLCFVRAFHGSSY